MNETIVTSSKYFRRSVSSPFLKLTTILYANGNHLLGEWKFCPVVLI
jgi:hypothetical protein